MPRNPDPKHGRWILPLIILAMVVLTIVFVTSLEPAEQEAGTTTTLPPPSTTTTTTLPTDVAAFMVTLDVYENQLSAFQADVAAINEDWEAGGVFQEALDSFNEVRAALTSWEDEVAGASDVPAELAEAHVDLVLEVEKLAPAVEDIIAGLEAPDDGTLRRDAVTAFHDQVDVILAAIDTVRAQAETTGTTAGEGETSTTGPGEEPTTSLTTTTTSTTVPTTEA